MKLLNKKISYTNRLGDTLVNKEIVSREIIDNAYLIQLNEPEFGKRKLGEILIQDFQIDRHSVYKEIALLYAFLEVDLSNLIMDQSKLDTIKDLMDSLTAELRNITRKNYILPYLIVKEDVNILYIAASDPTFPEISTLAKAMGFMRYEVRYCNHEIIQSITEVVFPSTNEYLEDFENADALGVQVEEEEIDEIELDTEINKSKLTNLVEGCFVEAVRQGASDIHFIPIDATTVEISFRVNGKLRVWHNHTGTRAEAVAAVLKDRSKNVNRFDRDIAQDGFVQREIDGKIIRFRVSILPIVGVEFERRLESIVVRILDDSNVIRDLEKLGLQERAKEDFLKAINKPQGIVILTGPTGSGKSTTLVAALSSVMTPELNVLTVEEPVEYLIEGARQLKINPKMDFDLAMRSILRHDPDIVMVGEIRDKKTAEIAFKLANTGHLTFSTLHTNDAASVISRLFKMGIELFLIAYAVNIVVAQRLIRKMCDHCKEIEYNLDISLAKTIGFTYEEMHDITFYKPVGCDKCHHGYSGRVAIHEALFFSKDIRKAILEMNDFIDEEKIKQIAITNGMLTLRASGRERIKKGETTCAEVAFITAED